MDYTKELHEELKNSICRGNYSLGEYHKGHKNINKNGVNVIDVNTTLTGGDNLFSRQLVDNLNAIPALLTEIDRSHAEVEQLKIKVEFWTSGYEKMDKAVEQLKAVGDRLCDIAENNSFCCEKKEYFLCQMEDEDGHDEGCAVLDWKLPQPPEAEC